MNNMFITVNRDEPVYPGVSPERNETDGNKNDEITIIYKIEKNAQLEKIFRQKNKIIKESSASKFLPAP